MASLQELNQYQGNAGLAAGSSANAAQADLGVGNFNLDAVDRLTAYTMQANRDAWVQANVDLQKQMDEAGKQLSVTYGNLIPEDRSVIDTKVADLYKFYTDNPTAVRYQVDPKTGVSNKEQYNQFLKLRQDLDHAILRGNIRAQQLSAIQDKISQQSDPNKVKEMTDFMMNERKKPIPENLLIPPNTDPFNLSKFSETLALQGQRSTDYLQRFPEDVLTITKNVFDPIAASAPAITMLTGPGNDDMKQSLNTTAGVANAMINSARNPDGTINMQKLQGNPDMKPIMDLVSAYNQQIDALNHTDYTEGGRRTGRKLFQMLGYEKPLEKMDISKPGGIAPIDVVRMSMVSKMGSTSKIKHEYNGEGLEWARLHQAWKIHEDGQDKTPSEMADEKIQAYHNILTAPTNGVGQQIDISETSYHKDDKGNVTETGKKITHKGWGYEVALTPQYQQAFQIPGDKTTSTSKNPNADGEGSAFGTSQGYDMTKTESKALQPYRAFVIPAEDGNPNKNRLQIRYEDNTTRTFSATQVWSMLNGMFGQDPKTQIQISSASMKRLNGYGLTQPDVPAIGRKIGNMQQSASPENRKDAPQDLDYNSLIKPKKKR